MHRLFLDANVLFTAAHNPRGKSAMLFDALESKRWTLLGSEFTIEEARRNIAAKYPQCLDRLDALIRRTTVVPQPHPSKVSIHLPEKDRPVYQAATAAGASHLLTGDLKHFGRHMNQPEATSGITIQTVADYLASL
jgi:predicted nucleic acid-binding protein